MDDAENMPDAEPAEAPAIPGAPIGVSRPDAPLAPITDPTIPELQDRRRPQS
jgi:hypothetical protein